MVEFDETASQSTGLWQALRHDPKHAPETAVLHALPQLAPHVEKWWSRTLRRRSSDPPERLARRVLRRSTGVARRGGLITGSSFYVGMVPAMAMIYCEQLVVVLRLAAVYGRDPMDPIRAAEILVIQGRYPTIEDAAAALGNAGSTAENRRLTANTHTIFNIVRQLPSMIGLRIRKFTRSPFDLVVTSAEIASYLVPVISLPVWAFASARATRRLGRAAINFYSRPATDLAPDTEFVLPPRPAIRTRRIVIGSVVPLAVALGVLFSLLPLGTHRPGIRWIGLVLGEIALLLTFARLIRLTHVASESRA
jgi:hypothetical protein